MLVGYTKQLALKRFFWGGIHCDGYSTVPLPSPYLLLYIVEDPPPAPPPLHSCHQTSADHRWLPRQTILVWTPHQTVKSRSGKVWKSPLMWSSFPLLHHSSIAGASSTWEDGRACVKFVLRENVPTESIFCEGGEMLFFIKRGGSKFLPRPFLLVPLQFFLLLLLLSTSSSSAET